MKRFVEGEDRRQGVLLPEFLDDYVSEENPVRVIDVFVEELDLAVVQACMHAVTVVLDLVQPVRALGRFLDEARQLWLDPFWRMSRLGT
jgi:hypothetical protein